MTVPLFSIITINYNNRSGLVKTIESVLNQSDKGLKYEFIIIDGGSQDGSKEIIEQYTEKLTYWVSEPDNGVYHAMNRGIIKANGIYLYFLNSGDVFENKEVLLTIQHYLKDKSVDILYGNVIDENTNGHRIRRERPYLSKINLFRKMICHQSIFAKKELFIKNGLFDETYRIKSDYDWLIKNLFSNANYKYVDELICIYMGGGMSETCYETISIYEMPKIIAKYYTPKSQYFIKKFLINPRIIRYTAFHLKSTFLLKLLDKFII